MIGLVDYVVMCLLVYFFYIKMVFWFEWIIVGFYGGCVGREIVVRKSKFWC